jgi:predicted transcriptional regulator of viral defense system
MQPSRKFERDLSALADADHALFTLADLAALLPGHPPGAFKTLVSRVAANGGMERLCRGLYLFPRAPYPADLLLYHAAARLRAGTFCYLSLESVLSDAGVISQVPMNWITLMTAGRSGKIACGRFGTIEFVHTQKTPLRLRENLTYDPRCRLWRASVAQALQDMRNACRNLDLIDWKAAHELV